MHRSSWCFKGTECPQSLSQKRRNLLHFHDRRLFLEFCPEPADAFCTGARHPTKASANELVFFVTLQAEAENFFVELAEFLGGFHPLGESFGKNRALASGNANAMEAGNGIPAYV